MDDKLLCIIDEKNKKFLVYDKSEWSELRSAKNIFSSMKSIFADNVKIDWLDNEAIIKLSDDGYKKSDSMQIIIKID